MEYYAAKNIVEIFNVPIETISNIPVYYWRETGCLRHEVSEACVWQGGFYCLLFCAFTFLDYVDTLPAKENTIQKEHLLL